MLAGERLTCKTALLGSLLKSSSLGAAVFLGSHRTVEASGFILTVSAAAGGTKRSVKKHTHLCVGVTHVKLLAVKWDLR